MFCFEHDLISYIVTQRGEIDQYRSDHDKLQVDMKTLYLINAGRREFVALCYNYGFCLENSVNSSMTTQLFSTHLQVFESVLTDLVILKIKTSRRFSQSHFDETKA